MAHHNEHTKPNKADLDEAYGLLDAVELKDSPHCTVDGIIRTMWADQTPVRNCYLVTIISRILEITFDEAITLVNRHVFFQKNSKELEEHKARLRKMKQSADDILNNPSYLSVQERFLREETEKKTPPNYRNDWTPLTMEDFHTEMDLQAIANFKEIPLNNFTTTGFKALEKTLHPQTAPNFKKVLIDDYMVMQKQLGIPFEEDAVQKLFGDSGVKHIWHTYGLLACQILPKTDPNWTIDSMGAFHDATREYEPTKSVIDDAEFFLFMSCTRRLTQITDDLNKIFTLLIFLYEEYANDKDWVTTWDFYYSLEKKLDELKPSEFADRMMSGLNKKYYKAWDVRHRNYDWNTIYRAKEWLATDGRTTFDNYIEELYFAAPNLKFPT